MDTIEIVFDDVDAFNFAHDQLLYFPGRLKNTSAYSRRSRETGYRAIFSKLIDEQEFSLLSDPVYGKNQKPFKFQCHLSNYENLDAAIDVLVQLWGPHYDKLTTWKINRFDICVDVAVEFELIAANVFVKNKRMYTETKSNGFRCIRIGKHPHEIVIYKKRKQLKFFDDVITEGELPKRLSSEFKSYSEVELEEEFDGTRIESRHWNKKVPIESLSKIRDLVKFDPFAGVTIYKDLNRLSTDGLTAAQKRNVMALKYQIQHNCGQGAKFNLNDKHSNFGRQYGKILDNAEVLDIHLYYLVRLLRFFNWNGVEALGGDETVSHQESVSKLETTTEVPTAH